MERKILDLEQYVTFLYDELEKKEVEIDKLKEQLDEAGNKAKKKAMEHSNDREDLVEMKKLVEEQQIKISCLREHRNDILNRRENAVDDYEKEFKEKEADIKRLQEVMNDQRKLIKDVTEKCDEKSQKIDQLDGLIKKLQLNSSKSSLSKELNIAKNETEKETLNLEIKSLSEKLSKSKDLLMKKD